MTLGFLPLNYPFPFAKIDYNDNKDKINSSSNWMQYWLKFKKRSGAEGSVIFDIDDTLIDKNEKKIMSVINIYKLCTELGFVVNIITARPESQKNRQETKKMLTEKGIVNFEAMYMMPSSIKPTLKSISLYKHQARADVASRHDILANIGDMWSDHFKFPQNIKELQERDINECAIFFIPGQSYPNLKLPGTYD